MVNTYIVTQKLPKELEAQTKAVENLAKVISQPALGQDDIKSLKEKIKATNEEIEEITNRRNVNIFVEEAIVSFYNQLHFQRCQLYQKLYHFTLKG